MDKPLTATEEAERQYDAMAEALLRGRNRAVLRGGMEYQQMDAITRIDLKRRAERHRRRLRGQ